MYLFFFFTAALLGLVAQHSAMFLDKPEPWSTQQLFQYLDRNNDGHIDSHDLLAISASGSSPYFDEVRERLHVL